jgi:hypothetical protein
LVEVELFLIEVELFLVEVKSFLIEVELFLIEVELFLVEVEFLVELSCWTEWLVSHLPSDNGSEFTAQIISDLKELWPELVIVHGKRATHRVKVLQNG